MRTEWLCCYRVKGYEIHYVSYGNKILILPSFFRGRSADFSIFIFMFMIQFIQIFSNFLFILLGNISLLTIRRHSWKVWNIHWPYNWFKLNFQHLNKSFLCLKYLCVLWLFLFYTFEYFHPVPSIIKSKERYRKVGVFLSFSYVALAY